MTELLINSKPITEVFYLCDTQHVTKTNYHSSVKDFPKRRRCTQCHKGANYVGYSVLGKGERVPNPKNTVPQDEFDDSPESELNQPLVPGSDFTKGHYKSLRERRTEEELELILEARLEKLRKSRGE